MRRLLLAIAFVMIGSAAHAACPSTLELQDANGVKAAAKYTDDGSGNCQVNTAIQDGADATLGAKADAVWATGSAGSVIAILKSIATAPPGPGLSNGWTPLTKIGISTPVLAIKTSAGQLGFAQCDNANATISYIQFFNLAAGSVTLGVTTPTQVLPIPGTLSNGFVMNQNGMQYSTAISAAAATSATGSTAPGAAINCTFGFN